MKFWQTEMKKLKKIFFITLFVPSLFLGQNKTTDSLRRLLNNAKHDTTRCNILNAMIEAENDDAVWIKHNDELLKLTESKLKSITRNEPEYKFYQKNLAAALGNVGFFAQQQGDFSRALEYDIKSLKIHEEIGDKTGIANSLNNIGYIYQSQGNIPRALECHGRSLKIREEIGDKDGIARSLNNIGHIYYNQGDIPKALEYHGRSLKIREEIGDKDGIARSLNNMGLIYSDQGDIPTLSPTKADSLRRLALEYYGRSLKIREEIGDKRGLATSLNNIGSTYAFHGDPSVTSSKEDALRAGITRALEYYGRSLKISEEIGNKSGIATSLINTGSVYLKLASAEKVLADRQKNYAKALEFFNRSMKLSREIGIAENISHVAKQLSTLYKATGNNKLALENYELHIQMRDSLYNEENKKAAVKSQLKYEYETKAAADSVRVAEEKKVTSAQLQQEKTQRFALYGGLALVGVFALFMVNRFRVTNKQKKLIEEQKILVEQQKEIVDQKQKEVLDSIHYAKRIQNALMSNEKYIEKHLRNLNS